MPHSQNSYNVNEILKLVWLKRVFFSKTWRVWGIFYPGQIVFVINVALKLLSDSSHYSTLCVTVHAYYTDFRWLIRAGQTKKCLRHSIQSCQTTWRTSPPVEYTLTGLSPLCSMRMREGKDTVYPARQYPPPLPVLWLKRQCHEILDTIFCKTPFPGPHINRLKQCSKMFSFWRINSQKNMCPV